MARTTEAEMGTWGPRWALVVTLATAWLTSCSDFSPASGSGEDIASDGVVTDALPDLPDDPGPPDADAGIELPEVDSTGACPGGFECPCNANNECYSGHCIDGPDGLQCTKGCIEQCPTGYDCLNVTTGGTDPVTICVPRHVKLCRPCQEHTECGDDLTGETGLCVPASEEAQGSFCATSCEGGVPCPEGYTCSPIWLPSGGEAKHCLPTSGQCQCRPSWSTKSYVTTCLIENEYGACEGTRGCGESGLTSCEGAIPKPESCNGLDDDCDGETDVLPEVACTIDNEFGACPGLLACASDGSEICEGEAAKPESCNGLDDDCDGETDEATCDDGLDCTTDVCTPDGSCVHTLKNGWCSIGGECVPEGTPNPSDPCEQCVPGTSKNAWSDADGAPCSDGEPCTWQDTCSGGACEGTPYACNDGLACTTDVCDGDGGCLQQLVPGTCLIDGKCVDEGTTQAGNACYICAPATSPKAWYPNDGGACDDGDACTQGDTCSGVSCEGEAYVCDDGNACTLDSCNGDGTCTFQQASETCIIGGTCYAAGTPNPSQPCLACRPEISGTTWSPVDPGAACDDGNKCTSGDTCSGGTCSGTSYSCNDGLPCTSDACDGDGGCVHTPNAGKCAIDEACWNDGQDNPDNPCQTCDASLSSADWLPKPPGTSCSDGQSCTYGDACNDSAQCVGTGQVCDDGKWCTADDCDGSGGCVFTPTGGCLIGGSCYAANAANPANPCEKCNPAQSTTDWSPASGASCNDGNACTHSDKCQSGTCVGTAYSCSDSLACTDDICNGSGGCSNPIKTGRCLIDGVCYNNGDTKPGQICQYCNSVTKTSWSNNNGVSCNDGNTCTVSDVCSGGSCGGTPDTDSYESNNTRTSSYYLGAKDDNKSWSEASSFTANLYPSGDVDWYRFRMKDNTNTDGEPDPRVELSNIPSGTNYNLCAVWKCDDPGDSQDVSCNFGSKTTIDGLPGCCSSKSGTTTETVGFEVQCDNHPWYEADDETGYVYIRVVGASGTAYKCSDYTIKYGDE